MKYILASLTALKCGSSNLLAFILFGIFFFLKHVIINLRGNNVRDKYYDANVISIIDEIKTFIWLFVVCVRKTRNQSRILHFATNCVHLAEEIVDHRSPILKYKKLRFNEPLSHSIMVTTTLSIYHVC